MLTLHQRRRAARTVHGLEAHARYWRDCANENRFEDDGLNAARGLIFAAVLSLPAWGAVAAIVAVCVWAFECFVKGTC